MSAGPDIGQLLAHLQGGGMMGGAPGGMMGGPPPGGESPDTGGADKVPALLQQALDALHKAFALETEPIDKAEIAKILTSVQQLFAQEQKEKDQALGGSNMKLLRRNR